MNQDPMIVIEQKDENKKRGALAVILAIAFVAILAIGGTFAYLTYTANQTPNRFTTGGLTADLIEPSWNKASVTDNGGTLAKDGSVSGPVTAKYTSGDGTLIPYGAAGQLPGSTVNKNPFVINTSTNADVKGYAGIKVQFQKWNKTKTGDEGGSWVNCSEDETKHILAVYNIESTATDNDESKIAGITSLGANWSQVKADGTTVASAGTVNEKGQMYFVNSASLKSLGSLTSAVDEDATSDTWGYTCGGDDPYATTELFKTVTFCKGATQANINALLGDLDPTAVTLDEGKTFTPGWRMVVSGAIIQDVDQTLDSGDYAALATLLDATSSVNRGDSAKPTKATGARSTSTLGSYYVNEATGVAAKDGNGVSEATNVAKAS